MRTVLWASVRVHARRYVATVVAVVVGVAFIVAANVLTSATRSGLLADAAGEYTGAGTVVSQVPDAAGADRVLAHAGFPAAVNGSTNQPLAVRRQTVTDNGSVGTVADEAGLRWQHLTTGRFPSRPHEAVVDAHAAEENAVSPGDRVTIGKAPHALTVTVTGLVDSSTGPLSAPVYLRWQDLEHSFADEAFVTDVVVASGDTGAVRAATGSHLVVEDRSTYLERLQRDVTRGVDVISVVLLVFAAIAFFVAALVIANTFAILLAQRARDFALLRCVGATRRQVRRSVRQEALVMGAGAATLGVVAGVGVGYGLLVLGRATLDDLPLGAVSLSPVWVGGAWLLGVLVTVVASLLPAYRGARTSPLAALRSDAPVEAGSTAGRVRLAAALVTVLAGVALLALAMRTHNVGIMLVGGMVSFVGVLVAGPFTVPLCVRLLGLLARRCGAPGRLATGNAVRNPRRTAATTASLLVGVTLVAGLTVGMATINAAVGRQMDKDYPLDLDLVSTGQPLAAATLSRARAIDGVRDAVALRGADVHVRQGRHDAGTVTAVAVDAGGRSVLRSRTPYAKPADDVLYLPWDTLSRAKLEPGKAAVAGVGGRRVTVRLEGADGSTAAVVSPRLLDRLAGGRSELRAVWVRADSGAHPADVRSALTSVGWAVDAQVGGGLEQRHFVDQQIAVLTATVLALLGVGAAIAVVGIGSTLGLSVLERAREHAVLRALGLTRRQLAGALVAEALLIATVAGGLGVALGTAYAWVGVRTLAGTVLDDTSVVWPAGRLALLVLAAAAAGLAAGVLPARRAAAVTPAAGLGAD